MLTLLIVKDPTEILSTDSIIVRGTEDRFDDLPQKPDQVIVWTSMVNIKKTYNLFKSLDESAQVLFRFVDDELWYTRDEAILFSKMRMGQ